MFAQCFPEGSDVHSMLNGLFGWLVGAFCQNFHPVVFQVPFPKFTPADADQTEAELKQMKESGEDGARASGFEVEPRTDEATKPHRWQRNNLAKQSGVPNVHWSKDRAWQVLYPTSNKKGKRTARACRKFSLSKFMEKGLSEAQADAAALEAAKAFRSELVKQGILKEPKPVDPNFTSEVIGVNWHKRDKKWQVRLCSPGKKEIFGGCFTEKAAAEAKALELAKEHGLERQVKAVGKLSELPIFKPKVPYPGVNWRQAEQKWYATCRVNGVKQNFRVKPKDHSEAELEASFHTAVAWRKRREEDQSKADLHQANC